MISELDNHKVLNLYVLPIILDKMKSIKKDNRIFICHYDMPADNFKYKGIYNYRALKRKYKKVGIEKASELIDELKSIDDNMFHICIFYITLEFTMEMITFTSSKDVNYTSLFGDPPAFYKADYSDEMIRNMVDWEELLSKILKDRPRNYIPVLLININTDKKQYYFFSLQDYIYLLQSALVATDMTDLIEYEYNRQDLVIVNVQHDLNDCFLLAHLNKKSDFKYQFDLISSPKDNSLVEKVIKVRI